MDTVNISVLAGHVNVVSAIHDRLYVCINADKNDRCVRKQIAKRRKRNKNPKTHGKR